MPSGIYNHKPLSEKTKIKLSISKLGDKNPMKRPEIREKVRLAHIGSKHTLEHVKKIIETRRKNGIWHSPETKEKIRNSHLGKRLTEEHKYNLKISHMGYKMPQEQKNKISQSNKGKHNSPLTEFPKGNKETLEFKEKRLQSLNKKPNKPEKRVIKLCLRNRLNFSYIGNGQLWFRGEHNHIFNPDFIHKSKKLFIEIFGDYWHNRPDYQERDKERFLSYNKYGYKTLVIWEHELKDMPKVLNKIKEFEQVS
jgi:very-short-patch-repair endonuclease